MTEVKNVPEDAMQSYLYHHHHHHHHHHRCVNSV